MEYQKNRLSVLSKLKKEKAISKQGERQYLIENSFVFDSSDKFIKKLLVENKWKNITGQSKGFVLKWIYMPKNHTFSQLTQNQRINHFPHTHILTTKLGLKRTLTGQRSAHLGWNGKHHSHFFPRSYDLSEQFDTFEKDFNRTAISNLTKKIMIAVELQANSLFHHLSKSVICGKRQDKNWLKQARQLMDYDMMWEKDSVVLKQCRLRVNSKVFQALLCYLSILFTLDTDLCEQDFSMKEIKMLAKYSRFNPPYHDLEQHFSGSKELAKLPSLSSLKLFFELYKRCYQSWCWFKSDGLRNIWVVKTSDSSRGRSIFLVQSLEDAQSLNNGMRTIQKYIEDVWIHRPNPSLKFANTVRKLENRKFDIRLWVAVKSFAPLEAFVYNEGYLRISQNMYQLLDISVEKSHLTNFSVNWSQEEDTQDSYLLLSEFLAFLQGNQIKSASLLKSQIYQVITQTLYSAQLLTNNGDSRCFQLFGFDIILDGDLKPWLLECNMSPACKQRGVLCNILEEMGTGLLSLVGIIDKHPYEKRWERVTPLEYSASFDKPKYINKYSKENLIKDHHHKSQNAIKILKKSSSVLFPDANILNQCRINSLLPAISNSSFHTEDKTLMVTGTKIGKNALAKLDNYYRLLQATITIQRFARNYFKPSKVKPSLLCLKLIEVLALIAKTRKAKHFKSIRRFVKKIKRASK